MQRNLYNHFCREAPRILSSLLQPHFQPLSVLDQDSLDRICQETANLVIQLVAPKNGVVPCRFQVNTTSNPYSEEAGPSNTHLLANYGPNQSQPLSDMNGHPWPIQGGPFINQLVGSMNSDYCYGDMGPTTPDFHQPFYTTQQPDLEQIYDMVGQHTFSWGNSPLPHHTHPDHVYS